MSLEICKSEKLKLLQKKNYIFLEINYLII